MKATNTIAKADNLAKQTKAEEVQRVTTTLPAHVASAMRGAEATSPMVEPTNLQGAPYVRKRT